MSSKDHSLMNSPSLPKVLAERDAVNTDAPADPGGNKNGPPGPSGNQKGPPTPAPTTEVLTSSTLTGQTPPLTTEVSSSENPPSLANPPTLTSSSTIVTSVLTQSTTDSRTFISSISSLGSSSLAVITSSNVVSITLFPVGTTLRLSTLTSTSSMTSIQTGMVRTSQSEHGAASPGLKAGIAVGTIAGLSFILALILLLFKYCRAEAPRVWPSRGSSRWLSRHRIPDAMSNSLLTRDLGSSDNPTWDYKTTFARSTAAEKTRRSRPLRKSLTRHLWFKANPNPLGLNPVIGAKPPSLKSFTSFFHRLSAASTHNSAGKFEDQINPQSPPPLPPQYTGSLTTTHLIIPGGLAQPIEDTDFSRFSRITVLQVPPQALHPRPDKSP